MDKLARALQEEFAVPLSLAVEAARRAIIEKSDWHTHGQHWVEILQNGSVRPAVNATGILLHTGLGRAVLSARASQAIARAAGSPGAVELDLDSGERGDRQALVHQSLIRLSGAGAAHVVNNCAGAVVLALAAIAKGREVILSRGQMVEIGGSYRMPEIVEASGCRLREVGCTNRTHLTDYEKAIGDHTGAILICHRSNFSIEGFTHEPSIPEIVELGKRAGIPVIEDLGSGCLVDTTGFGLPKERTIQAACAEGADLVLASGDKLLGGPQAGLIFGESAAVNATRNHPLARALRVDKLTLAGLDATLFAYLAGTLDEIPVWRYAGRSVDALRAMATQLGPSVVVEESRCQVGGGSMPSAELPSIRVGVDASLAPKLRKNSPAIVGRVQSGKYWLDLRCVEPGELAEIEAAIRRATNNQDENER